MLGTRSFIYFSSALHNSILFKRTRLVLKESRRLSLDARTRATVYGIVATSSLNAGFALSRLQAHSHTEVQRVTTLISKVSDRFNDLIMHYRTLGSHFFVDILKSVTVCIISVTTSVPSSPSQNNQGRQYEKNRATLQSMETSRLLFLWISGLPQRCLYAYRMELDEVIKRSPPQLVPNLCHPKHISRENLPSLAQHPISLLYSR